jgi:amino acid transporter
MPKKLYLVNSKLILSRFILCSLGYVSLLLGLLEPESLNFKMIASGGVLALVTVYIALVLNVLATIDIFINDVLPSNYTSRLSKDIRYLVWSILAAIWMMYTFVLLKTELSFWLAQVFLIYSLGCITIAILDTMYENDKKD